MVPLTAPVNKTRFFKLFYQLFNLSWHNQHSRRASTHGQLSLAFLPVVTTPQPQQPDPA